MSWLPRIAAACSGLVILVVTATVFPASVASSAQNRGFERHRDVRELPRPLKDRLLELAKRPQSYPPLRIFSEADDPSLLFAYYLLDATGFQPNVFTTTIDGINDGIAPTATGPNHDLPTIGAVRLALEPKPGLPTDPHDPGAFIDIFTDISGLFVINNESGWYEGWMIHDLVVPPIGDERADLSRPQFGTMTVEDAAALAAIGGQRRPWTQVHARRPRAS